MKKNYILMCVLCIGIGGAVPIDALQGTALISPDRDLTLENVALEEKIVTSQHPVGTELVILNPITGANKKVTVVKSVRTSSIVAAISKDLASKIDIPEGGGYVEILTLPEAEAYKNAHSASNQKLAMQEPDVLPDKVSPLTPVPEKPAAPKPPAVPETPPALQPPPAPETPSNNGASSPDKTAEEPKKEEPKIAEPQKEEPKITETKKEEPKIAEKQEVPQVYPPAEPPSQLKRTDIKETPVLAKAAITPEAYLPGNVPASSRNSESPVIREEPNLYLTPEISLPADAEAKNSGIGGQGEPRLVMDMPFVQGLGSPEINLPSNAEAKNSGTAGGGGSFLPIDRPLAQGISSPEISLPAETADGAGNGLSVKDMPFAEAASTGPEINLPADSPIIAKNSGNSSSAVVTDWPLAPIEPAGPEINLPAEVPQVIRNTGQSRIDDTPAVNERVLPPEKMYNWEDYALSLVPAEKRPPAERSPFGLPPEAEVPPVSRNTPPAGGTWTGLPPEAEVPPISRNTPAGGGRTSLPPEAEVPPISRNTPPQTGSRIEADPISIMTGDTLTAVPPPQGPRFSVPLIGVLEKGKYYLQLAALSRTDQVESELSKIGRSYPLAVQNVGNMYRILVGPINPGESGALLQRFRGIGYKDAFVRQGI